MSETSSSRVSFAGLKAERTRNKQNDMMFQNFRALGHGHSHSQTIITPEQLVKNNPANNVSKKNDYAIIGSNSTRFQQVIKDKQARIASKNINQKQSINRLKKRTQLQIFSQDFLTSQQNIRNQIQQYNIKFSQVTQMLQDLHIKDLMKFNQMLDKNQQIYNSFLKNISSKTVDLPSFIEATFEDSRRIFEVEKALLKVIAQPIKSFDFRSTYQSRNNKKTTSTASLRVSPQLTKICSPQNSQVIAHQPQKTRDSIPILPKNTTMSHSGSVNSELICEKTNLEDTPESVKSKISFTSKIKTEKDPSVGMFDRINICESIQDMFEVEPQGENIQKTRQRNDYRYRNFVEDL